MKALHVLAAAGAIGGLLTMSGSAIAACADNWQDCAGKPWVDGDKMETPLGSKWWPHPIWGEGDEAGSTNWYKKPEVVMRALALVKKGETMKLGHEYEAGMPLFGARKFSLRIPGTPTGGPFGATQLMYNDEFLATEIGQVGTQFDGLGHIGVTMGAPGEMGAMRWYNGFTATEMHNSYGLNKLGTEKLHPIVARGILIDVAAIWGKDMVAGDLITMAHVKQALLLICELCPQRACNLPGYIVLYREYSLQFSLVSLGPKMLISFAIDQLCNDPHSPFGLLRTALKDCGHIQFFSYFFEGLI